MGKKFGRSSLLFLVLRHDSSNRRPRLGLPDERSNRRDSLPNWMIKNEAKRFAGNTVFVDSLATLLFIRLYQPLAALSLSYYAFVRPLRESTIVSPAGFFGRSTIDSTRFSNFYSFYVSRRPCRFLAGSDCRRQERETLNSIIRQTDRR